MWENIISANHQEVYTLQVRTWQRWVHASWWRRVEVRFYILVHGWATPWNGHGKVTDIIPFLDLPCFFVVCLIMREASPVSHPSSLVPLFGAARLRLRLQTFWRQKLPQGVRYGPGDVSLRPQSATFCVDILCPVKVTLQQLRRRSFFVFDGYSSS